MSKIIIFLAIILQISFAVSALWTGWYDYFFFGSSLHRCCQGLDFYQVPNGAYAVKEGGDLSGALMAKYLPYSGYQVSNSNVYHPFFTVLVGNFFLFFEPLVAFYLWIVIKLLITLITAYYLYRKFKTNRHIYFALYLFLGNFVQYSEIKISQFQYLFNIFFLFFLLELTRNKDNILSGIFYYATLLIKPVGLLWVPVLLIRKKWTTLFLGMSMFGLATVLFQYNGFGNYYIYNLISHIQHPVLGTTIDALSLEALLRHTFPIPTVLLLAFKAIFLLIIVIVAFFRHVEVIKIFYLLTLYFLFFYDYIFQYHFTIVIPLITVGYLVSKDFQTRAAKMLLFVISLPNLFFLLRLFHVGLVEDAFLGIDPTWTGWKIVGFGQFMPLVLLAIVILQFDLRILLKRGVKMV